MDFIGEDTAAVVADDQADLVIIGRGKTQDILRTLRTHTYDIIKNAPCPVLSYCADEIDPSAEKRDASEVAVSRT